MDKNNVTHLRRLCIVSSGLMKLTLCGQLISLPSVPKVSKQLCMNLSTSVNVISVSIHWISHLIILDIIVW